MTETHTPPVGMNYLSPSIDVTMPANTTGVVAKKLTIASGKKIILGSGAVLLILG